MTKNEQKLDQFLKSNPYAAEVIRITPDYYQRNGAPPAVKFFFSTGIAIILGAVIVGTFFSPAMTIMLIFAIPFSAIFISIIWAEVLIYPYMLQSIITDGVEIIRWRAIYGIAGIKRYPIETLDYIERRRIISPDTNHVSHQLVLVYPRDEYGRKREDILWDEGEESENVIEMIERSLKQLGFEVKRSVQT